jgi:hypothetical protein
LGFASGPLGHFGQGRRARRGGTNPDNFLIEDRAVPRRLLRTAGPNAQAGPREPGAKADDAELAGPGQVRRATPGAHEAESRPSV